jgi:hypothetical protein
MRTRQSTPSRLGPPTPNANDGGTIVTPPRGGTAVQSPPGGTQVQPPPAPTKSRAPLLAAAVLLAAAGGGYVWWSGRTPEPKVEPRAEQPTAEPPKNSGDRTGEDKPTNDPKKDNGTPPKPPDEDPKKKDPEKKVEPPPPPPFARADELEGRNDLAGAIAETERVGDAAAQVERTQRLARLRGKRAAALLADGKLLAARDELRSALQLQDAPELQQQRQQLRTAMAAAAEKALRRERPDATTPQPADREIEFAGVLQADFVQELRLGGEEVARKSDGSFRERRRVGADGSLAVAVRVDDEERALLPWRVTLAAPPPGLTFVGSFRLTKPRADGRLITADSTVSIDGKLSEPGGELLVDGQPVRAEWRSDGSFTVSVQVPKEGPSQLQFEARKDGRSTPVMEVEVVRPPKTQWEPVEPKTRNNNQIARTRTLLKVRMSNEYADTVVASCDGQKFELQRDPENPKVFAGEITLTFGQKRVEVVVTNLVGITSTDAFTFNCTARVPSLAIASLREGSDNRTVGRDPLFVRSLDARLLLQCDDPEAELLVDGEKVAATTPFGLDLRPFLREGQARTLALRTRNENGPSDERKLTITLDTVAPTVVAEPVTAAAPGSTVVIGGTWRERSDGLTIVVEGVAASLVRKDAEGGTWTAVLRAPAATTKWRMVATDAAGNRSPEVVVDVPVAGAAVAGDPDKDRAVAPPVTPPVTPPATSPTVTPKELPGFRAKDEQRTQAGYPLRIVHERSGIELVAIAVDGNGKPGLYAAVREVSEKQWEGAGGDGAKTSISGEAILGWLADRGQGLQLPSEADWSRLVAAGSPELKNLRDGEGVFELLAPASAASSSWPLKKDPSTTSFRRNRSAGSIGFRVVYRPK